MPVHCYLPIRIRLVGVPAEAQLDALPAVVARIAASRLAQARRGLAQRHDVAPINDAVREPFESDRAADTTYRVPSHDGSGAPVGVPVAGNPRPWLVLRALSFRTTVGDFLDWVDWEQHEPLPGRVLYADLDAEVRRVTVWWVQINRTFTLAELSSVLVARAGELAGLPPKLTLAYGLTATDSGRAGLADIDLTGQVRALPALTERNARRLSGAGPGAELLHGSRAVFAFLTLPKVTADDLVVLAAGAEIGLPLREAGFLVDAEAFAARFGVSWDRFVDEFGDEPVQVTLQPVTARKEASTAAVVYLVAGVVAARRSVPPSSVPAQGLWLLTEAELGGLPPAVRRLAQDWTDPSTRALDVSAAGGRVGVGWRMLYAQASLVINSDRISVARLRPLARRLASMLRQLVRDDPTDRSWRWRVFQVLDEHCGWPPPAVRPDGGTLFEHTLAELEITGDLVEFYDAMDAARHFGLRHKVLLLSLSTTYATHPRVRQLHTELSAQVLAGERSLPAAAGEVLGDRDSIYIVEKDIKRLKPARARQLREACERERTELVRRIDHAVDGTEYSEEEFATRVLTSAAQAVGITEADFEEIRVQRSIRLVEARRGEAAALPSVQVAFRFVERRKGGAEWVPAGEVRYESEGEFQARLTYWRLGRAGEVYEAVGIGVSVVGLIAVAWEAGIVGALVSLAGGGGAIGVSITISEVIYILRIVFGDATLSACGVLVAALDGYLTAVGFRAGAGLGMVAARRIGTASLRRLLAGWVVQRLVTGAVGGALSAGLTTFSNDVVAIATGTGSFSSIGAYVDHMYIGAAVGIVAEFALAPALHALITRGDSALSSAGELVTRLREGGWSGVRLSATLTEGLANLRGALTELVGEQTAREYVNAFRARLGDVLERMAAGAVARRVLELSGARFTRTATEGLQRFLTAAESATPARALAIANVFTRYPQETVHFLEVLAALDTNAAHRLVTGSFGSRDDLAAFLGRLARYTPDQQRSAIRLLAELDIRAGEPQPTLTTAEVLNRQLSLSLRLQAAGLDVEGRRLAKEIRGKEQALKNTAPANARRVGVLRQEIAELTNQLERRKAEAAERSELVNDPSAVVPDDAEVDAALTASEEGTAPRDSGAQAWIRVKRTKVLAEPDVVERLVRPIFRSRTGNRVVFRVEGGSHPTERSKEFTWVDANGDVRINTGGEAYNVNFGVFERAIEFLIGARAGARLKVFEIEEAWFRVVRGVSIPEQGTRMQGTTARLRDVKGLPRTVDTRYGEDQLQVPGTLVRELQEFVVPRSGRVVEFW